MNDITLEDLRNKIDEFKKQVPTKKGTMMYVMSMNDFSYLGNILYKLENVQKILDSGMNNTLKVNSIKRIIK
jgi:hypothetical protein